MQGSSYHIMRLVKQKQELKVKMTTDEASEQTKKPVHSCLLPNSVRAGICGSSGAGKTCILMTLIEHPLGVKFKNVYVFSNSLFQPKYQRLRYLIESIPEMKFFGSQKEILPFNKVLPFSLVIFDDMLSHSQNEIQNYFSMGRHKNLECFFLCQTYSFIAKQLLRDNLNLIILLQMDKLNLKHVFDDHVSSSDVSFKEFSEMCQKCWEKPFGFLVISKDSPLNNGRFRCGFDEFYIKS